MQNIGTPRIYIDHINYQKALGIYEPKNSSIDSLWVEGVGGLKSPTKLLEATSPSSPDSTYLDANYTIINENINWAGWFGHNLASSGVSFYPEGRDDNGWLAIHNEIELINWSGTNTPPLYDGFSMCIGSGGNYFDFDRPLDWMKFTFNDINGLVILDTFKVGSLCFGNYFDFPHSPELKITQSIEMGELTRQKSVIGSSLSNSMQTPNMWGDLGAWELNSPSEQDDNSKLGIRRGKKIWNLSFSYLSDKDTLPINAMGGSLSNPDSMDGYTLGDDYYDGGESGTIFGTQGNPLSVLNGEDFFSAVWNKTLGGHLPFIFQPDKDNNNPDQFAICKFDQDSLQVEQVANTVYNVKLKIREI